METAMEFEPTNIKVLIACKVTFDLGDETVTTHLYARDSKSAINQAVKNKRESLKKAADRKAEISKGLDAPEKEELPAPQEEPTQFTASQAAEGAVEMADLAKPAPSETLDNATEMAEPTEPDNAAT